MKQAYINKDTKFAASSGLHRCVIFLAYAREREAERILLQQIKQNIEKTTAVESYNKPNRKEVLRIAMIKSLVKAHECSFRNLDLQRG